MNRTEEEWSLWCVAAMLCEGPTKGGQLLTEYSSVPGLCALVAFVAFWSGAHAPAGMHARLSRHDDERRTPWPESYWWPRTRAGWNARARFCWRRAAECEAELNGGKR